MRSQTTGSVTATSLQPGIYPEITLLEAKGTTDGPRNRRSATPVKSPGEERGMEESQDGKQHGNHSILP